MTLLQIMPDDAPDTVLLHTRDEEAIAQALRERSVSFTRWPLRAQATPQTASEELLDAYRAEIDELCARQELRLVDVARLHPEEGAEWQERAAKARSTFLDEHRHAEDEVRFFAHGTGCFYLHLEDRVYAVVCEAGDLLSVPAGTRHWFDMGPVPDFCAIRFFEKEDGWVGDFTQEPIADGFPRLDALLRKG
ncbi:cupin [Streptomyces sp. NRRL_ISP-5395]|uniref:1,2-dihydroxy-3-keto-5-methylthiopentene dioxygenase n=1 Tax=Streptomyces TaxID=1883 RepID=UPI0004AB1403|nr:MULTISPECIES: cupin [Streptomyces]MDX2668368.1 cupin [Streptomyces sp. NRRL_ISP-5395]GHF50390.1 acireductone dioxygenase [Streptomyces griseus]